MANPREAMPVYVCVYNVCAAALFDVCVSMFDVCAAALFDVCVLMWCVMCFDVWRRCAARC